MNTRNGREALTRMDLLKFVKGELETSPHDDTCDVPIASPGKNPYTALCIEVAEFDETSLNCLYPLKLLLVRALRVDTVTEISWEKLKRDIEANQ